MALFISRRCEVGIVKAGIGAQAVGVRKTGAAFGIQGHPAIPLSLITSKPSKMESSLRMAGGRCRNPILLRRLSDEDIGACIDGQISFSVASVEYRAEV